MFDPLSIVTGAFASLKAFFEFRKSVKDDVQGEKLIDVRQQVTTLQSENHELREEIKLLKQAAEDKSRFQFLHGVYWKIYDMAPRDGEDEEWSYWEGPFCPACKDV